MPRRPLRSLGLSIPPPSTSRPHAPSRTQNTVKSHAATARETRNPTNCSSCSSSMRELLPPRNSSKTIAPRWSRRSSGSLALNSHQPPQPMTSSPSSLAAIPVTTTRGSLRATLRSVSAARNRPMPSTFHNVERHQRTGMEGASTPSTPSTRTDVLSASPTAPTDPALRTRTSTGSGSAQTSSETSHSRTWIPFSSTPSPTCGIASTRPPLTTASRPDPPTTSSPSSTRPAKSRNRRMQRTSRSATSTPSTSWNTAEPLNSVTPPPSSCWSIRPHGFLSHFTPWSPLTSWA